MDKRIRREIIYYLFFTFIITWLIWCLPYIFNIEKLAEEFIWAGSFVPSISAIVLTAIIRGKKDTIELLKSLIKIKYSYKWYLYSFLLIPIIFVIAFSTMKIYGKATPNLSFPIYALPLIFLYIMALMGPLGEELGWRGFLLDRFLTIKKPILAALFVGIIWSLWHLPLFFFKETVQNDLVIIYGFPLTFLFYSLYTIMISIFISLIFIRTKKSTFAAIVFHTMANLSIGAMPLIFSKIGAIIQLSFMGIASIIVLVFIKNKKVYYK